MAATLRRSDPIRSDLGLVGLVYVRGDERRSYQSGLRFAVGTTAPTLPETTVGAVVSTAKQRITLRGSRRSGVHRRERPDRLRRPQ